MRNLELENIKKAKASIDEIGSYDNWGGPSYKFIQKFCGEEGLDEAQRKKLESGISDLYRKSIKDLNDIKLMLAAIIKDNE